MTNTKNTRKQQESLIRELAEKDLLFFIRLVTADKRVLGAIHEEVIQWWNREEAKDHQLLLLPRDHQKSVLLAYRCVWEITRNPATTILYISATANLAEKQLYFMKNILTSKIYQKYWPDMINPTEGKRERWTSTEISVDHPKRREEGVRDPTIFTAGLTTSITGLHFNIAALDDIVVKENATTEEGRQKVAAQYSLLASIETTGAKEWVVGTRYHPKDLYADLITMEHNIYDTEGNIINIQPVYEVFQREVEDRGDGTGEYLWPRQQRADGRWFGFDINILAQKKAKYIDQAQFFAQYYNNPNDPTGNKIDKNKFQYYNKKFITNEGGTWFYGDKRLNVVAAIDFAFSLRKKADYTSIVVIGIDNEHNIYVLDIDRFKTNKISVYYEHILRMYNYWGFRKLRAEISVAQEVIVRELKDQYIKPNGIVLKIDEFKPNRHEGTKEERMSATLDPRYDNLQMWHYKGGNCQLLEEELMLAHPPHDDIKDALTAAVDIAVAPSMGTKRKSRNMNVSYNNRFGGVAFR